MALRLLEMGADSCKDDGKTMIFHFPCFIYIYIFMMMMKRMMMMKLGKADPLQRDVCGMQKSGRLQHSLGCQSECTACDGVSHGDR